MIFDVFVRDGDSWDDALFVCRVEVDAASPLDGRLVAEQLAYTPHPTKPEHVQIVRTVRVA